METAGITFGEEFRMAIKRSRELALAHGNAFITSNHLLLAVLAGGSNVVDLVSTQVGFAPAELHSTIERTLDAAGAGAPIELDLVPLTEEAEGVMKQAVAEFLRRAGNEVDAGDLLMAMLAQQGTDASEVLSRHGISYERMAEALGGIGR